MMRILCLAIVSMLLPLSVSAQQKMQTEFVPLRTITVSGMAERQVVPDEAHISVNLNSLNARVAAAKAEHDKKLTQLLTITEKAGIEKSKVKTQSSSVQPEYSYDQNKRVFKGYRVQTMLDITVKPIDKVGGLIEQITSAGFEKDANTEWGNLLSVSYGIAEPNKIRDDMTIDAIRNARVKADKMAEAAGLKVARVYQINEGSAPSFGFPQPPPMMRMMKSTGADVAQEAMAPPPGEQEVQATVSVVFELKD